MAAKDVASMFQYWKEFNLTQLQRELDDTATDLANRQDESDTSRKRLVEQSREFKKNTPEDVRKQVAPLLKSFQAEVDSLSKRSKAAEGAFLSIYKKLIDTPDPTSVLEYCVNLQKRAQKAQDLEIENQKLRETLEEYNKEFAEVKNQEVTIKNLQTKLKEYEERSESVAQARADEKEKELHRDFAEKEKQLQEKQMSVAKKLGEAELKITTLQNTLDNTQSELFDIKAKYDEQGAAKSDEMELLMTDLERANQKVAASEKLIEGMKGQLQSANQSLHQAEQMQSAPNVEQAIDILTRSSLEVELTAKEKEISQLVDDVQRLQASSNKLRETTAARIQKLEEELTARNTAFKKLEERLKGQSDYEEIKRELSVLKSIEFSSSDGGSVSERDEGEGSNALPPKSLEMLLLEKNRALQTENTTLKVNNTDLNGGGGGGSGVGPGGLAQAQAFASLIGQEVAAAYHQRTAMNTQVPGSPIIQPIIVMPPTLNPHAAAAAASAPHMGFIHPMAPSHLHQPHTPMSQSPVPSTSHSHTPEPPQPSKTPPNTIAAVREAAARELAAREAALQQAALRELAMSHQWVDTVQVARRIKDILADNNIGQRLFGEVVLNMSQGSVSDLLSRPKPWDKMTAKGREPFIKMLQFLSSHHHLERLKIFNLQKKGKESPPGPTAIASPVKASSDEAINNILALAKQEMEAQKAMAHEHARRIAHEREEHDRHSLRSSPDSTHSFSPKTPLRNESEALDMSMGSDMRHLRDLRRRSLGSISGDGREPPTPNLNGDIARKVEETLENINKTHAMMHDNSAMTAGYGPGRAPKRILPPLSCDQYENSKELDTVDIARQVRELLVKGNIPQRVFGEHIIGMSQGSVSDILSKPKTWDKLTIKGKEPFIRMKIWLDCGGRMDKLKELVRRGNYSFTDMSNSFQADTTTPNSNCSSPCPSVEDQPLPLLPATHITKSSHHQSSTSSPHSSNSTPTPKTTSPAPLSQPPSSPRPTPSPRAYLQSPSSPNAMPELPPVHEQAAMIEYLDTFAVTQQVKNLLQQHGLGQKAFGEAVLGLTQGSVSDLLSKPKMWLKLSMKGREPYVRMYLWLQDLEGIAKVKNYKPKRKARRYVMVNMSPGNSQGVGSPPSKRARVLLTPEEKDCLKASYDKEPYPTQATIDALAEQLNLPTSTVINWFHNHRSRLKRGAANVDPENRLVFHTHTESDMSARHALMQEEVSRRAVLDERLRQERENGDVREDSPRERMDEERVNDLKQAIVALENASREEEVPNQERGRYQVRQPEDWMEGQEEMEDVEYDDEEEVEEEEEEDIKDAIHDNAMEEEQNVHAVDSIENGSKRPKQGADDTVQRLQNGVKEEKGEWDF
ncbi:homeobox protein cut-like 1 isoform X1 [Lytechinus variegatus]|uniref:homeobox protein cut-like 1 isoform X1 n=1 Tax=Lytechinus variegatus TaxID=7654 RepID=UPI001BB26444|nr:homeobox protein cut-like 1 isoform X1 [Lytechinus variegatus]